MSTQSTDGAVVTTPVVGVDCTVSVSRNAPGDLEAGVHERLASADGIAAVESLDLSGITPGLNDLTVTVTATVAVEEATGLTRRLEETFGIREVTVESRKGPP
jgi:Co/Zn/Cd efflux system component